MTLDDLRKQKRSAIISIAGRHGVTGIRVFGSFARGEARADSDIDLLIETGPFRTPFFPGGLIADLEPGWAAGSTSPRNPRCIRSCGTRCCARLSLFEVGPALRRAPPRMHPANRRVYGRSAEFGGARGLPAKLAGAGRSDPQSSGSCGIGGKNQSGTSGFGTGGSLATGRAFRNVLVHLISQG